MPDHSAKKDSVCLSVCMCFRTMAFEGMDRSSSNLQVVIALGSEIKFANGPTESGAAEHGSSHVKPTGKKA